MDVFEAIRLRRSIRSFEDRPVEDEVLEQVLEAGRLAPSAGNRQDWLFVVVRDAAKRKAMVKACRDQAFVGQAPVIIVACATGAEYRMSSGLSIAAVDGDHVGEPWASARAAASAGGMAASGDRIAPQRDACGSSHERNAAYAAGLSCRSRR